MGRPAMTEVIVRGVSVVSAVCVCSSAATAVRFDLRWCVLLIGGVVAEGDEAQLEILVHVRFKGGS